MAKKKEDLGGVWRTVGGRRIFIKDGQDLYEAMNDSGKFTNLKRENFKRKEKFDTNLTNKIKTMTVIGADNKIVDMNMKEIERIEDAGSFYDIKFKNGWGMKSKDLVVAINGVETKEYLAERKAQKIDNFIKNNPKWENGNYDEDEFDDLADTLGISRDKVSDEIYDRIREKSNKSEYLNQKETKVEDTLTSLRKADNWNDINSAIDNIKDEKLKTMMKKEAQKLEENENGAWKSADYLAKQYNFYKEDFERGSKEHYDAMVKGGMSKKDAQHIVDLEKGNKRLKQDSYGSYHTKTKVDSHDLETLNRIADNYENENDYDMDDISKDYIKNRRNEMSYNKRNDEFVDTLNKTRNKTFRANDEVKIRDKDGNEYSINKENRFQTRDGYFDANELDNGKYLIFNNEHGVYYEVDNISEKTLEKYRNYHKEDEIKYNSLSELAKKYPEVFKKTTERNIYTDKNGAKIGHSMVVQYATMNHLTIEEAKRILGVK